MSDGPALYHEELQDLEQQLEGILENNKGQPTAEQVAKGQAALKRLNKLLQQLRIEVRMLDDASAQKVFEAQAQTHSQKIASLKSSLQRLQQEQQQAQRQEEAAAVAQSAARTTQAAAKGDMPPLAPAAPGGAPKPAYSLWSPQEGEQDEPTDDGKGEARQATKRIQNTQQNTLKSLGNAERMLNETETMGQEAATTLRKQTEQIQQTNVELDEMHTEVGRAGKELKAFMRRMARDRIIICFSIAIVVCLIVIVVLAVLKHKWK